MLYSRLPLMALAAALAASPGVDAAEWVAEPSVRLDGKYNDNIRLTQLDHNSVWGTVLDPRLKLSRRSELWDVNASGRLLASRYTGEDGMNAVDSFLDIAAKRRLERGSWDISASQVNDSTLRDEILDPDIGLTTVQVDRTNRSLRIAGQYLFAEDTWLLASIDYNTASYDQGEYFGLTDYDYLTPSLRVVHQLDPQLQLFGILSHSQTDYDTFSNQTSKTDNLQLGAAYDITETWKISGSVGNRRTTTSDTVANAVIRPGFEDLYPLVYDLVYLPRDRESTGLVYDTSLTHKLETGSLNLSGTRSVTPSSTGTDTDSTRVAFLGTRNLNAKLYARLAVSYHQSSAVGGTTTRANNRQYRITPGLTWRLDEYLALNAGYAYTQVKRSVDGSNNADSNAVFVGIEYTWPQISVSR